MPELPEVEGYRRFFEENALRKKIERVRVLDKRILERTSPAAIDAAFRGATFVEARRHGKHFFARASNRGWLHLHFGMTGDLSMVKRGGEDPRFAKVIFDFRNDSLAFEDARLFGFVAVIDDADAEIEKRRLGPDPLSISRKEFVTRLSRRRGGIKALLMNQTVLAGLGNLYVDETLFQSGVAPLRSVQTLDGKELASLYRAMQRILGLMIARQTDYDRVPSSFLLRHRDLGEQCPRCGGEISRATIAGRTTYFCLGHQS